MKNIYKIITTAGKEIKVVACDNNDALFNSGIDRNDCAKIINQGPQ